MSKWCIVCLVPFVARKSVVVATTIVTKSSTTTTQNASKNIKKGENVSKMGFGNAKWRRTLARTTYAGRGQKFSHNQKRCIRMRQAGIEGRDALRAIAEMKSVAETAASKMKKD